MNFKELILVIAIVVVVVGAAIFLMSNMTHPKADSKMIMTSNATLDDGDNFTVKLTDLNNTPIPNQSVSITIVSSSSQSVQKTLHTDKNGQASLEVNSSTKGSCAVKIKYAGNEKFNGCNLTENLKINEKVIIQNLTNNTSNMTSNMTSKLTSNLTTKNTVQNQIETVEDRPSRYYYYEYSDGDVVTYEDY